MITISKIENSLHDMGWTKAAINFITDDLENEDGVVGDYELLCAANSLEALTKDLRQIVKDEQEARKANKIYEYLRNNNLDFAEFEEMAHLLLD